MFPCSICFYWSEIRHLSVITYLNLKPGRNWPSPTCERAKRTLTSWCWARLWTWSLAGSATTADTPWPSTACPWLSSACQRSSRRIGSASTASGQGQVVPMLNNPWSGLESWIFQGISTAAMDMLAGEEGAKNCRTVDIMADAAYVMLTRDSKWEFGKINL